MGAVHASGPRLTALLSRQAKLDTAEAARACVEREIADAREVGRREATETMTTQLEEALSAFEAMERRVVELSDADAASSDASDASAPVAPAAKATEALAEDISSGSDFDAAAMEFRGDDGPGAWIDALTALRVAPARAGGRGPARRATLRRRR